MAYLIVPGLAGSGPGHWQHRWLAAEPDMILVEQANWDHPEPAAWLATLERAIWRHPHAILVGHSLGGALIALAAARNPDLPVAGAVLVAPADVESDAAAALGLGAFGPLPTRPLPFPATLVASRTDPYMAFERARVLANMWEAVFVDAGDAGHINIASGHGDWPDGLALARAFARQIAATSLRSGAARH